MNEKRSFTDKEIRTDAMELAQSLGATNREDVITDIIEKIKDVITKYKVGVIFEDDNKESESKKRARNVQTFEEFLNEDYFKGVSKSTADKKKSQMAKQAAMDDDDPEAYKEMPGDTKGKKSTKTSNHTKKYHEMYGKKENFTWEAVDENDLFEAKADEEDKASTDQGPLDNKSVETGLANKKEETGAPIGILRAVFRRGMAAWKGGHRPGIGQDQWAYARVNSFLTGGAGTWGKADKDLATDARAAGFDAKKK